MSGGRAAVFSRENRIETPVYPHDMFVRTDAGDAEIHGSGTRLPPEALEVLVLLDGKRTVGDLEAKLATLPAQAVRDLLRSLLAAHLVRAAALAEAEDIGVDFAAFFAAAGGTAEPAPGAQASAAREAQSGVPRLERQGYYVSIARQAVRRAAPAAGFAALIVEDDPDVSTLVKRLLEMSGFSVTIAASREEVAARLRRTPMPDAIVLDVQLPDLNGFDLLQRLKAHPVLKQIPVVMLTADAAPESIVRGLALGADGYITKPFEHAAVAKGVKAVLGC